MSKICHKWQKLSKISQTMVQKRAKNFSKWAQNNYLQPILSQFWQKLSPIPKGIKKRLFPRELKKSIIPKNKQQKSDNGPKFGLKISQNGPKTISSSPF